VDYHAALVEGQQRALDGIRPGVAACEVFQLAVDGVRRAGIPSYDRSHVGHGIGIAGAGYDLPSLAPSDETLLEPGMVLCVETPYIEVGYGGLQVEDMIVVTEAGYRPLTHLERQLQVVP
jgi:Xaa-Pro aminopeptidase